MDIHKNASTTPRSRMLMVERLRDGWPVAAVAAAHGVDPKTVRKWRDRFLVEGDTGLEDRSSRPRRSPNRTPLSCRRQVLALRRDHRWGAAHIAFEVGIAPSTVQSILRAAGQGRLDQGDRATSSRPRPQRYERERPGELIHIDTKKLGKIDGHRIHGDRIRRARKIGWEHLDVAVDDASRLAYTEILPDEHKESACIFLTRPLAFFKAHGVAVERVMTDNGSAYLSQAFKTHIGAAGCKHIRTRPYTPRTNGKAERFIQTSLREWAYLRAYQTSAERTQAMLPWITSYNHSRPHSALGGTPPLTRLNNALGFDS